MADDQILPPLRGVSTDPTNITKLDADNNVLTSTTDLDARFVNVTGDTMTGNLIIERDGTTGGNQLRVASYSDADNAIVNFWKTRGTKTAQTPLIAGDYLGRLNFNTITTAGATIGSSINCNANGAPTAIGVDTRFSLVTTNAAGSAAEVVSFASDKINLRAPLADLVRVDNGSSGTALEVTVDTASANSVNQGWGIRALTDLVTKNAACFVAYNTGKGTELNTCFLVDARLPAGANNYSFYNASLAQSFFRGPVGINWASPTHALEVGGPTMLRGTCEITGNITSAGTAHAFAAASIPASAIGGNFTTVSVTGGRSSFAPLSEPYAIGIRYNAAGLPNYIGTTATGDFQISSAGGVSLMSLSSAGNITTTGTAHNFAANSIPAAAIKDLPITAQVITQAAYDALAVKSPTTLYLISG
jgi:hypothetical protein